MRTSDKIVKISGDAILVILLLLLLPVQATPWNTTSLACNEYTFTAPGAVCTKYVNFTYPNGTVAFHGECIVGESPACGGSFKINNSGYIRLWNCFSGGYGSPFSTGCNASNCDFNVIWYTTTPTFTSDLTRMPYFQGCEPPELVLHNFSILADRYKVQIGVEDNEWQWKCNLILVGELNMHNISDIISNSTHDILFTDYPRQMTVVSLSCHYLKWQQGYYSGWTEFASLFFVLDPNIQYHIADLSREVGNADVIPKILYAHDNASSLYFRVISSDKVDYGKPIKAYLNTTINTSVIGCSFFVNKSGTLYPNIYSLPLAVSCQNTSIIPLNLSVYDAYDNTFLDSIAFNLTWYEGNMIIDNINLIRDYDSHNLELWATVSTDYYKTAIPDTANLSCNFSMTSYDTEESFSGSMGVYRTYDETGMMVQTDVRNISFDDASDYNYSNKFAVAINCSASNYSFMNVNADRWVGYVRLKRFKCLLTSGGTLNYPLVYVPFNNDNRYNTQISHVTCFLQPDLVVPANASAGKGLMLSNVAAMFSSRLYLLGVNGNIGALFYSQCPHTIYQDTYPYNSQWNLVIPIDVMFQKKDSYCISQELQEGKETMFSIFASSISTNGSIFESYITPTSAMNAFNLSIHEVYSSVNVTLRIANNKTRNIGVVENGDTIYCTTYFNDPGSDVVSVVHKIINSTGNEVCRRGDTLEKELGNDAYEWNSVVIVNSTSCPFFARNNSNGTIYCASDIFQYDGSIDNYFSNPLGFRTEASEITIGGEPSFLDWIANNSLVDFLLNLLYSDPLRFILLGLLSIIISILFVPPVLTILIAALFSRENKEG